MYQRKSCEARKSRADSFTCRVLCAILFLASFQNPVDRKTRADSTISVFGDISLPLPFYFDLLYCMTPDERPEPLSWEEARSTLRDVLESYLDHPPPPQRGDDAVSPKDSSWLVFIIRNDYDLYFGAFLFSIGLLILSLFSLLAKLGHVSDSQLRPSASQGVYKSQFCASALLAIGACGSLWMVRRRRFLSLNDSVNAKRREVMRFLPVLRAFGENRSERFDPPEKPHINGTSLTDIYRVYRKAGPAEQWNRIPSLLLVKGDFIAMQCGDIAPADCVMMLNGSISSVQIKLGSRLSLQNIGLTKESVQQDLPKGRSTLQPGSTHLLTLCNHTQMFLVLDTPLNEFIYRPPGTFLSGLIHYLGLILPWPLTIH